MVTDRMSDCSCCGTFPGDFHYSFCSFTGQHSIPAVLDPKTKDVVNSPPHYTTGKVETIDYIEQVCANYYGSEAPLVANAIKYISRAPLKGKKLEDLKKAQWYLNRLVKNLENN